MQQAEIWKDVSGYEGLYQVSNIGRVKSLSRISTAGRGPRVLPEKILKPVYNSEGYIFYNFPNRKKMSAHRIVLQEFEGKCDLCVDHINGIKDDNRLENLRYCTRRENIIYAHQKKKKYVGVWSEHIGHYRSRAIYEGKTHNLGIYKCETAAMIAREKFLNKHKEYEVSLTN